VFSRGWLAWWMVQLASHSTSLKFAKDHEVILRDNLTHRGCPTVDQFVHHDCKGGAVASLEPSTAMRIVTRSP
jgi:hypothetical protein